MTANLFPESERTMWKPVFSVLLAGILSASPLVAQDRADDRRASSGAGLQSPAEQRMAAARAMLKRDDTSVDGWNELALALARRARETADPDFYRQASDAVARARAIAPGDFTARKLQVWILLGQHEFAPAVAAAEQLNREVPDDVLVYGFLVDGYTELGRYADAEKAAQWMLDLRPGNVPGLTRAAHLRELFGDHSGAVELMDTAYRRTPDGEVEDRAWILTHIAHLSLLSGRLEAAEAMLGEALRLMPDYHYALAQLAELRTQQGRADEAVAVRERHVAVAPHPENRYELGVALQRAGRLAEARVAFAAFEAAAQAERDNWDNANVELIYHYAADGRAADALALATSEAARRGDVRTKEAHAWALHVNGRHAAARAAIDAVLAVGVRQPQTYARAAAIAAAQGDDAGARDLARRALSLNDAAPAAADARALLGVGR